MLPTSRGVLFSGEKSDCGKHIDHGVLGGTLKSTSINNVQKIHANKIQRRVLPGKKAPAAGTSTTGCLEGP